MEPLTCSTVTQAVLFNERKELMLQPTPFLPGHLKLVPLTPENSLHFRDSLGWDASEC